MRQRNLYAIVLTVGVALAVLGALRGQPPAWAPTGGGEPDTPPSVIASTRASTPNSLPPDARMPLPDDGLPGGKPLPAAPTATARPPASLSGEIQRANYVPAEVPLEPERGAPTNGVALGVEVQGPAGGTPQQPYAAVLFVRNLGRDVVSQARVELPVPAGVRVLSCEPQAERPGDRLSWLLGNLEAGAVRRLSVELLPSQAGEIHLRPHASYEAAIGLRTNVVRPPFALAVTGPETAAVGDRVVIAIQLGNHTSEAMRRVQVLCKLSPGLHHEQGEQIEAELANGLAVGEVKTLHLQAEARGTGKLFAQVSAVADGRDTAGSQHFLAVNEPSVSVTVHGPRRGTLGHELAYRLEVSNPGKVTAVGVRLRQALPKGVSFGSASSAGGFDEATQSIEWALGDLQGGQRQSVTFQVKSAQVGDWAMPVTLSADSMVEVRATHAVHVDASPTLAVEATAEDDPLDLGRETVYEVRVFNQGTTIASGVALTMKLPEQLAAVSQDGPTRAGGHGQLLVFDPIDLKDKAAAVYKVKVRGQRSGQGRVRIEVTAAGLAEPVLREMTGNVRGAVAGLGR